MKIIGINGFVTQCEAKGVQREVSLFMMQGEQYLGDNLSS